MLLMAKNEVVEPLVVALRKAMFYYAISSNHNSMLSYDIKLSL